MLEWRDTLLKSQVLSLEEQTALQRAWIATLGKQPSALDEWPLASEGRFAADRRSPGTKGVDIGRASWNPNSTSFC